jgi:PAT family beta-lactamase induction signal transducer AmpG
MPRLNLLSTPRGRLAAFTLLYLGEGLPQGLNAAAVTLELRRLGMDSATLGAFAGTIMLPWAWKWAFGPLVDNLHLPRFGRRSQWIIASQVGMIVSLLVALAAFPTVGPDGALVGVGLFTTLLLVHNTFSACQDVAIDALAVTALGDEERGRANGFMFGAAQLGIALGGSGVIALKGTVGFTPAALIVPTVLLGLLTMMLRFVTEARDEVAAVGRGLAAVGTDILDYLRTVLRVFFTTRRGFLGLLLAVLPAGSMALSLTVGKVIQPALGMTDGEIAGWDSAGSVVFAIACVLGGAVSDRWGRRPALALFASATVLPTLYMAWRFADAGWAQPPAGVDGVWPRAEEALILAWNVAGLVYAVFVGLMYGVRSALYMDIAEPRIAATQFTASMALLNLVTVYSYWWEGQALAAPSEGGWGFTVSQTLMADAALGLLFLGALALLPSRRASAPAAAAKSASRPA